MIQNLALITDQHSRIVNTAHARCRPLVESNMGENLRLSASLLQRLDLWPVDQERFLGQAAEEAVIVYGCCDAGLHVMST